MKSTLLALALTGLLMSGCASSVSTVPMASIQTEPPLACRIDCPWPPSLAMPRNDWEAAITNWGMDCAALHSDCVNPNKPAVAGP